MYVCMHVCICIDVRMFVWMYVFTYVCMHTSPVLGLRSTIMLSNIAGTTHTNWSPASQYARLNKFGILRPPSRMGTSSTVSIPVSSGVVGGCCGGGGECEEDEKYCDIAWDTLAVVAAVAVVTAVAAFAAAAEHCQLSCAHPPPPPRCFAIASPRPLWHGMGIETRCALEPQDTK